jgi:tetratricopeptide (TPR) repeat protein
MVIAKIVYPLFGQRSLLAAGFAVLIAVSTSEAQAMSPTANSLQFCNSLIERAEQDPNLNSPAKRAEFLEEQAAGKCEGTGLYNVRLASLYLDASDSINAERVAHSGLLKSSEYAPNLNHVLVEVALQRGDRKSAQKMAEEIAAAYPNYTPILGTLADFAMADRRWDKYLELFQRAHRIEPEKALPLLGMAIALHQLDRHEECVARVYEALKLEPIRIARTTGVKEAIFSLGILKRNKEAAELLRRHMNANPEWAKDPGMVSAAKALGLA